MGVVRPAPPNDRGPGASCEPGLERRSEERLGPLSFGPGSTSRRDSEVGGVVLRERTAGRAGKKGEEESLLRFTHVHRIFKMSRVS